MGQVWQAFVGVRTRRVEGYYQDLLAVDFDASDGKEHKELLSGNDNKHCSRKGVDLSEKWKKQIEKVIRCMGPGLYRSIFLIRRCYFFLGPRQDGLQKCLLAIVVKLKQCWFPF